MRDDRLTKKLLVGAVLGAIFGLAAAWVIASRSDIQRVNLPARKDSKHASEPISLAEIAGLGMSVMRAARQASELVRKA